METVHRTAKPKLSIYGSAKLSTADEQSTLSPICKPTTDTHINSVF